MKFRYLIASLLAVSLAGSPLLINAQTNTEVELIDVKPRPVKKFYMSNALDAAIFSSSSLQKAGRSKLSTLRFSYILNFGFNFNYDFNKHFGVYTGIGIKNIGFIDKIADSTIKRRVYTIGAPIGIKFGNLKKRTYGFIGGGVDVPFNYREKGFVKRGKKDKFNEWFSDRTPLIMPYVFAGVSLDPGIAFKVQYYPSNFMNTSFAEYPGTSALPVYPYAGYNVNLIMLSIGFDIRYTKAGTPKSVLVAKN
ncbi:MAG: hypothetical protein ACK4EY_02510 [Flavipsychrobacter sp.]